MTVSVVVVSFVALFITAPVQGFTDQSRRAKLVDAADSALSRMGRDVRRALPNSIRTTGTGGRVALELLGTIDGARYRAQPPGDAADLLDITAADDAFDVIGPFTQIAKPWSSTESLSCRLQRRRAGRRRLRARERDYAGRHADRHHERARGRRRPGRR